MIAAQQLPLFVPAHATLIENFSLLNFQIADFSKVVHGLCKAVGSFSNHFAFQVVSEHHNLEYQRYDIWTFITQILWFRLKIAVTPGNEYILIFFWWG